jgi:hypothetical protein
MEILKAIKSKKPKEQITMNANYNTQPTMKIIEMNQSKCLLNSMTLTVLLFLSRQNVHIILSETAPQITSLS